MIVRDRHNRRLVIPIDGVDCVVCNDCGNMFPVTEYTPVGCYSNGVTKYSMRCQACATDYSSPERVAERAEALAERNREREERRRESEEYWENYRKDQEAERLAKLAREKAKMEEKTQNSLLALVKVLGPVESIFSAHIDTENTEQAFKRTGVEMWYSIDCVRVVSGSTKVVLMDMYDLVNNLAQGTRNRWSDCYAIVPKNSAYSITMENKAHKLVDLFGACALIAFCKELRIRHRVLTEVVVCMLSIEKGISFEESATIVENYVNTHKESNAPLKRVVLKIKKEWGEA